MKSGNEGKELENKIWKVIEVSKDEKEYFTNKKFIPLNNRLNKNENRFGYE